MSHVVIIEGLVERFEDGLAGFAKYNNDGELSNILDYEPTSVQTAPTIYMILDSFPRTQHGNVTTMRERIRVRLCTNWQDNQFAERELMPFVNSIPAAIDADAQLGNRINSGIAAVVEIRGEYINIGGALHRAIDFFVEVVDKGAYGSGI